MAIYIPFHEEPEAEQYRINYLIKDLLVGGGYGPYAEYLIDLRVEFTSDPGILAAVDPDKSIIYINEKHKYDDPNILSMLIRHEILHVVLDHVNREMLYYSEKLGFDISHLTGEQVAIVFEKMASDDFNLRSYNAARFGNEAGDLELTKFMQDKEDVAAIEAIGGLFINEYPEFKDNDFTMEQMIEALKVKDKELRTRCMKKLNGHFDPKTGDFILDSEEDSEFDDGLYIRTVDLIAATLLKVEQVKLIKPIKNLVTWSWLYDMDEEDPDVHPTINGNRKIESAEIDTRCLICPVLYIKNADLYKNIFKPDIVEYSINGHKYIMFDSIITTEFGSFIKDKIKLYCIDHKGIGNGPFNKLGASDNYNDSLIKPIVDSYFETLKRGDKLEIQAIK